MSTITRRCTGLHNGVSCYRPIVDNALFCPECEVERQDQCDTATIAMVKRAQDDRYNFGLIRGQLPLRWCTWAFYQDNEALVCRNTVSDGNLFCGSCEADRLGRTGWHTSKADRDRMLVLAIEDRRKFYEAYPQLGTIPVWRTCTYNHVVGPRLGENCGARVPDGALFCTLCTKKMERTPLTTMDGEIRARRLKRAEDARAQFYVEHPNLMVTIPSGRKSSQQRIMNVIMSRGPSAYPDDFLQGQQDQLTRCSDMQLIQIEDLLEHCDGAVCLQEGKLVIDL